MKSADVRRSARRIATAGAALVLAFAGLGVRAVQLSLFDQRAAARGDAQSLRTLTLPPERGAIVDRDGAALALSVDAPSVYVVPDQIDEPQRVARALGRVLGVDAHRLAAHLREASGFRFVERWVTREQAQRVQALGLAGVGVVDEPRRIYPHRTLAARQLGFANIDGRGVRGIEQQEDAWLRGTTRRLPVERDGSGRLMLVSGGTTWGTAGGDVALTLDAPLQAEAEHALEQAVAASGARGGLVISLDPFTGEIYTLAESPSFDPNAFRTLRYDATRSTAWLDALEPGSTFKAFLIASALERGSLQPDDTIDCEQGSLRIPGKTIRDHHPHGELDPAGILRVSSNVGAVKVAEALGRHAHYDMLRRFGFGEPTGAGFPDESAGVLRPWQSWQPVDQATIAFGQGVSVTAVQLAAASAVFANGGEWVRPRLVRARRAADGPWQPTQREGVRRVLSRETAATMRAMLETVVSPDGTGARAALRGVRVAGKTGTAQKLDPETGRYSQDRYRAWFVGFVPADDPRLVVLAELDEPQHPGHTGGVAAAPLFARVAATQLARFGIFTEPEGAAPVVRTAAHDPAGAGDGAAVARAAVAAGPEPAAVSAAAPRPAEPARRGAPEAKPAPGPQRELPSFRDRVLLPDFRGLTVAEVMRITESSGLHVKVSGHGRAVRQDPPPGTVVAEEEGVRIEFAERVGAGEKI
jgi:cell division protein FtsI (penicillin-binding protein 3)